MSLLQKAQRPADIILAPIISLIGTAGVGKSSLAGMFPKAIFVQAETASTVFEDWEEDKQPMMLPQIPTNADPVQYMKNIIRELMDTEHDFKTLVIDTGDKLNGLFEAHIARRDQVATVADASGGFHKGYVEVAAWHAEIFAGLDILRKRKRMAIVVLFHAGIKKRKNNPDEASEYTVLSIDMHEKSSAVYINNSDAVLYLINEKFVTGEQKNRKGQVTSYGRVTTTGERILVTSGDGQLGYVDAKNRYGLDQKIPVPLGTNPLLNMLKFFANGEVVRDQPEYDSREGENVTPELTTFEQTN